MGCGARGVARPADPRRARGGGRRRRPSSRRPSTRSPRRSHGMLARSRADAGCSTPAHADARSEWALAGCRRERDRARRPRSHASSPTACAGSSISRPARTKAPTSTRSSTANVERYRDQLERYARFVRALDARPIRLALYYPLLRRLARMAARDAIRLAARGRGTERVGGSENPLKFTVLLQSRTIACGFIAGCRLVRRRSRRADDRQFRRRPSRPPGDARAARRGRGGPRAAAGGADVRSAAARVLRRGSRAAAALVAARQDRAVRARTASRASTSRASTAGSRRSTPEAFVDDVLVRRLGVRWLLVGEDFRFGKGRAGDLATLRAHARTFSVEAMRTVAIDGERASSTAVRAALAAGDLAHAGALLGRPFAIAGRVAHGAKLGRNLGFPTANIRLKRKPPVSGIFAVRVHGLGPRAADGVASLGVRPTVSAPGAPLLEVFIFDFDETIYGRRDRRRVRAQAARRGALPRPRRADAPDRAATSRRRATISHGVRRDALTPSPNADFRKQPTARMPDDTENRLQDDAESAGHAVSDARRPRQARAGLGQGLAGDARSTRRSARRRRAARASCCTTARRTRTATSTSATRSTRS